MPTPAERLALLLEVHDDSLRSAAERCGLDHTTLMRVKGGETENPATLAKIAEGYGVPESWVRGEPDLAADFTFNVLSQPLQERVMLLWERNRRAAYALKFLRQYDPSLFTVQRLAEIMGLSMSEVQSIMVQGHRVVVDTHLERLCEGTGLPHEWFRTGLIGREDEHDLLVGLATLVLTSLSKKLGADIPDELIQSVAIKMV